MKTHLRAGLAATAAGVLLVAGWATFLTNRGARAASSNLLVITLDTTRADRLGAYGSRQVATPNLDWLARTGELFEQATTAAPLTLPAHCSLFTARYPPGHGVRDNNGFVLATNQATLAEILRARRFRTGAFPSSIVLDRRFGLNRGFDTYADDFDVKRGNGMDPDSLRRPAPETVDRAIRWLSASAGSPFFAWIHFYDAHAPYDPPEPYATRYRGRPYDGSIAFMDAQIGRLIDWLSERALLDRTVIVVLADHGESLGEHGEWTHALRLYESVVHVPLIVRAPTLRASGRRIRAAVRSVDVMPTVLSLLGIAPPPGIDGVSLVPLLTGASDDLGLEAYAETLYPKLRLGLNGGRTIRAGRLKLIEQDRMELYDVITDPREAHDLSVSYPAIVERLKERLDDYRGEPCRLAPALDLEYTRRLAALGYVNR